MEAWIGVDLDGTLAEYNKFEGAAMIGKPIPAMVERVKEWLKQGIKVKIFTARIWEPRYPTIDELEIIIEASVARAAINRWTKMVFGEELPVTCEKDYGMLELWDDRAVQIEPNTGKILGRSTRNL